MQLVPASLSKSMQSDRHPNYLNYSLKSLTQNIQRIGLNFAIRGYRAIGELHREFYLDLTKAHASQVEVRLVVLGLGTCELHYSGQNNPKKCDIRHGRIR